MDYPNKMCVEACNDCVSIASYCAQECIEKNMTECIKHCLDCVEICKTLSVFAARDSQYLMSIAQACADVCDACAQECDKHDQDSCKACAKACRACAKTCRELGGSAKMKKSA